MEIAKSVGAWIAEVLGTGAVAAALLSMAAWLSKEQISAWLNKDLEHVKADLQRLSTEHSVRFTKLHEKRAEVIAEHYSLLAQTMWAAEDFLAMFESTGEPSKREKSVTAHRQISETYRYFDRHRIYLPTRVCTALDQLLTQIRQPVIHFSVFLHWDDSELQDHTARQKIEAWTKGYATLKETIPAARAVLEVEFRVLLGEPSAVATVAPKRQPEK